MPDPPDAQSLSVYDDTSTHYISLQVQELCSSRKVAVSCVCVEPRYLDQFTMKPLMERPSPRWDPTKVYDQAIVSGIRDDPSRIPSLNLCGGWMVVHGQKLFIADDNQTFLWLAENFTGLGTGSNANDWHAMIQLTSSLIRSVVTLEVPPAGNHQSQLSWRAPPHHEVTHMLLRYNSNINNESDCISISYAQDRTIFFISTIL
eukprot:g11335.t1